MKIETAFTRGGIVERIAKRRKIGKTARLRIVIGCRYQCPRIADGLGNGHLLPRVIGSWLQIGGPLA
jgi:hypothetical protein